MTDTARTDALLAALFAPGPGGAPRDVYAVLDAARDPRIHRWIHARAMDFTSLYAGALARDLREVAPYLVHLYRGEPFTRELLTLGWGRSWGIFVSADATMEQLRLHFRRFLRVRDEGGRRLLFRWYDPRVLRLYLPTCTAAELETVFGPVDRFFAEDEGGEALLGYRRVAGALETRQHPVT